MKLSLALSAVLAASISNNNYAYAFAPPSGVLPRVLTTGSTTAAFAVKKDTDNRRRVMPSSSSSPSKEEAQTGTPSFENPLTYEGTQKEELDRQVTKPSTPQAVPQPPTPPPTTLPEVFKGIHIAPWDPTVGLGVLNEYTVKEVGEYVQAASANAALFGKPKDNLDIPRTILTSVADLANTTNHVLPTKEYNLFGNSDYPKQLVLLLKTNPFMASALTESKKDGSGGGFELKSYDPNETNPSLFLRMLRTLNGDGHRVNFQFTDTMEIKSFTVFDSTTGEEIDASSLDVKEYASSAIYNLMFYASSVHATIHVFHYLLTSALMEETKDFDAVHQLAVSYGRNIRNKYSQVGTLLIRDPTPEDTALITGVNGFGSSQAIRPILEELLNTWGKTRSSHEFFMDLMNISRTNMDKAGILVEFRKHFDLVQPFARDLKRAMVRSDPTPFGSKFRKAENGLKKYLKSCGTYKSNLTSIQQWIELMSVTGIIHGATISYTRLFADPGIMKWRNVKSQSWDAADINMVTGALGTVVGMEEGRHVMGSELDGGNFATEIQNVLDEYDQKANTLKEAHKRQLLEGDRDEFNNFGFILSDYGPDGFDGKQATIATYI